MMPTNTGTMPGNIPPLVDLQLRNGWTVRDRDPKKYRWSLTNSPGDIDSWQPTENTHTPTSGKD